MKSVLFTALATSLYLIHSVVAIADDPDTGTESIQIVDEQVAGAQKSAGIQLTTTSVTGSRELPKVLVIVPWKTSEALGPGERPLASLVEEALTPVDPDVFRRQLDYYTELNDSSADDGKASSAR